MPTNIKPIQFNQWYEATQIGFPIGEVHYMRLPKNAMLMRTTIYEGSTDDPASSSYEGRIRQVETIRIEGVRLEWDEDESGLIYHEVP